MIGHIRVRERGSTPRRLKKRMNANLKDTWRDTGTEFHAEYRPDRFTQRHARAAKYTRRSRRYTEQKRKSSAGGGVGRAEPLVFSGESKRLSRMARISSTSKGTRVVYPALRKLNLRTPGSRVRMSEEFRRITPREARSLPKFYDEKLDARINADNSSTTTTVT